MNDKDLGTDFLTKYTFNDFHFCFVNVHRNVNDKAKDKVTLVHENKYEKSCNEIYAEFVQ